MKSTLVASFGLFALLLAARCNPAPVPPPTPDPVVDAGPAPAPSPTPPPAPTPPPSPTVVVDAGPAPAPSSPEAAACDQLFRLGCAEGQNPTCEAVMRHAVTTAITKVDLSCITRAATKAALKACGFVRCQ